MMTRKLQTDNSQGRDDEMLLSKVMFLYVPVLCILKACLVPFCDDKEDYVLIKQPDLEREGRSTGLGAATQC
jgi:hypothetical protein